ncbi:MAG: hypothetical protein U5Q16_06165 [Gammaproteobacteria bacterium]|nr:hypothetical protein [Gammaproteobacteria bacterium]
MSGAEISLLAVTIGFIALVVWVYQPKRRDRLESYGEIPREHGEEESSDDGDRK